MIVIAVCVDGPSSKWTDDGDEVPEWLVYTTDEHGNDLGEYYYCDTYHAAITLGRQIAHDRHLELDNEATPE